MSTSLEQKSSIATIQARFDKDVARFSNLAAGQTSTMDAALAMELITEAAIKSTAVIKNVLDIGCGAGNNTIKLAQRSAPFDCDLVDLSMPMLEKAHERLGGVNTGNINIHQGDFRTIDLPAETYDVILAAAVLHHLRDDQDWQGTFAKIYQLTKPGGSVWITDLVSHESGAVDTMMWQRYGEYLASLGGPDYRERVFAYIDEEDSPRPVTYQLELLRRVGFAKVELLHKNACFAAFGAIKVGSLDDCPC
jgi:tRNA (cmo5U34)-methyltransferase